MRHAAAGSREAVHPPFASIRLEPAQADPLHRQLASHVRSLIRSGQVGVGAALPGELDLATALGVSRHTVRQALGALVNEGLLHRQRGAKTVVAAQPPVDGVIERNLGSFYAFAWETEARGARHRSRLLSQDTIPADARLAQRLSVGLGSALTRIERVRTADDEPLTLEVSVVPAELVAGLDRTLLESCSIYDLLERLHGVVVLRAQETIRPVVVDRRVAELLDVKPGSAAFSVERVSWSDRRPVEWQESIVRGDRYLYSVELPRPFVVAPVGTQHSAADQAARS